MTWDDVKVLLRSVAEEHGGRLVDLGLLVELVPPGTGSRIRVSGLDPESVRVETGWFLRITVELDEGSDHLREVVAALMTGRAQETVGIQDGRAVEHGWHVEYPSGARSATPVPADPHAVQHPLPAWGPADGPG
ncbi:hypothetical protein DQ237_02725 [Blastococcus sp. TF02-8]|uniref:hypothetical protein n=1 Tax=Blastococcus sp. TF02-8 TaxID=2250574 RepID=UPI000DEA33D2|nr:hypothetical protein [Blastococcus sp. TF02-8]RBY97839.1 hypothetical protein DQ237_02725 [Blastococcus sp. TF02-8]